MEQQQLKNTIEAVLMSAEKPLKVNEIENLFAGDADMPTRDDIRKTLQQLGEDYANRGFELKEVASGFRIQVKQDYSAWVGRLWEEKPARYSRALLETLALIAYRQPITRGEIEEIRGVSVSSNIIKTMMEREWIKVLGHKDVPGKPALYGTSKEFLDYFNLKSLEDLPTLAELKDLDQMHQELDLDIDNTAAGAEGDAEQSTTDKGAATELADADTMANEVDESAEAEAEAEAESDVDTGAIVAEADAPAAVEPAAADTAADEADEDTDSERDNSMAAMDADNESSEEEDYAEAEPRAQSAAS
jgi:segregation and condensation protein B